MANTDSDADVLPLTDERWRAILANDAAYDGQFCYAVRTTGIFCRPSCKSRPPNAGNVRLFRSAEEALSESFRPCKRCRPTGRRLPDDEWIASVAAYIDSRFTEPLSLERLAEAAHGSPYHLHRTFKKVMGMTPVEYIQRKRVKLARKLLRETGLPVAEVGLRAGWANTPYFVTLFKKMTGVTPAAYRERQKLDSR
ncbi:bifunctional transcriptional activator/DNA repair enzyme AdaA [Cohnella lubricantis]|uniref:Methylphosphotriester-DNA--protein-cysteine methyltransferase family protein n=1 Tax=Cohnella lubricantis TaxID=2163172 RepID=A0A841TDW1_9BACL|nr:bifunctional transcriptional activator/DNA repair enzyme AdaA [Cohnella lubricantis]MBB6678179.1 methylphosphotriester-DNA--protein-cysteine methyltransferase family protein [Cohnella lubricantis]MBP2119695.1 AraC family transcriptional regulator of adaptative response / methylphosphotriester-DNA alkyltransferase methyltransferase [Cohnella lubricantis]